MSYRRGSIQSEILAPRSRRLLPSTDIELKAIAKAAAMGLSSLDRTERGQAIDLPCLQLGPARIVLLPGEAFVGYQLMAQQQPFSVLMIYP